MFKKAQKFFLNYMHNRDYVWSVNEWEEIQNVWCWLPNDVCQWTIIRSPSQPMPQAEAIWIMFESWNHERITHTWFCQESAELDKALQEIKTKYL